LQRGQGGFEDTNQDQQMQRFPQTQILYPMKPNKYPSFQEKSKKNAFSTKGKSKVVRLSGVDNKK
jgi:hypothetical protein